MITGFLFSTFRPLHPIWSTLVLLSDLYTNQKHLKSLFLCANYRQGGKDVAKELSQDPNCFRPILPQKKIKIQNILG